MSPKINMKHFCFEIILSPLPLSPGLPLGHKRVRNSPEMIYFLIFLRPIESRNKNPIPGPIPGLCPHRPVQSSFRSVRTQTEVVRTQTEVEVQQSSFRSVRTQTEVELNLSSYVPYVVKMAVSNMNKMCPNGSSPESGVSEVRGRGEGINRTLSGYAYCS